MWMSECILLSRGLYCCSCLCRGLQETHFILLDVEGFKVPGKAYHSRLGSFKLTWGNCTWYWGSVDGVKGGKIIWWEWNKCWRSVSVVAKISLQAEHEYWIWGIIVVTACGADWIEIGLACDVWCTVDESDGNGWSKSKQLSIKCCETLWNLTWMNLNRLNGVVLVAHSDCVRLRMFLSIGLLNSQH